jgi:hypothetical protein
MAKSSKGSVLAGSGRKGRSPKPGTRSKEGGFAKMPSQRPGATKGGGRGNPMAKGSTRMKGSNVSPANGAPPMGKAGQVMGGSGGGLSPKPGTVSKRGGLQPQPKQVQVVTPVNLAGGTARRQLITTGVGNLPGLESGSEGALSGGSYVGQSAAKLGKVKKTATSIGASTTRVKGVHVAGAPKTFRPPGGRGK